MTTRTPEIENAIVSTVSNCISSDGWADLAKVGASLKKSGVDYGLKLSTFFDGYSDIMEVKSSDGHPPVKYVRLKQNKTEQAISLPEMTPKVTKGGQGDRAKTNNSKKRQLGDWALMVKYNPYSPKPYFPNLAQEVKKAYALLKGKILGGENWYYGNVERDDYPILRSYLNYTFYRLQKEDEAAQGTNRPKKIMEAEDYAAFNTGLVDNRYRPIFALFKKNPLVTQPYQLLDFCTAAEGNHTGKELVRYFKPLPERAHYFDKPADMLYDITCGKPETNLQHIVRDNADRLPIQLLKENLPKDFNWQDPEQMSKDERKEFFRNLGNVIYSDDRVCRRIEGEIDRAIDLAIKRVGWNFKTGIPMYFPTNNIMSILLPLSIMEDDVVDAALVVEKTKSGNYLGHTVLTLEMAYSNARLVSRPDSDWLAVDKINKSTEDDSSALDD